MTTLKHPPATSHATVPQLNIAKLGQTAQSTAVKNKEVEIMVEGDETQSSIEYNQMDSICSD